MHTNQPDASLQNEKSILGRIPLLLWPARDFSPESQIRGSLRTRPCPASSANVHRGLGAGSQTASHLIELQPAGRVTRSGRTHSANLPRIHNRRAGCQLDLKISQLNARQAGSAHPRLRDQTNQVVEDLTVERRSAHPRLRDQTNLIMPRSTQIVRSRPAGSPTHAPR